MRLHVCHKRGLESLDLWTNTAVLMSSYISVWLVSRLFVSDLETCDGHLLFPNWVFVPGQPLFPLPLLLSAGDRWACGFYTHLFSHTHTDADYANANVCLGIFLQGCLMADLRTMSSCSSSTGYVSLYPFKWHHKIQSTYSEPFSQPLRLHPGLPDFLSTIDSSTRLLPLPLCITLSSVFPPPYSLSLSAVLCHVRVALCQWPSVSLPLQSRET